MLHRDIPLDCSRFSVVMVNSMWHRLRQLTFLIAMGFGASTDVFAQTRDFEGTQASGSIYRISVPPATQYNEVLVIYAHGFQDATDPVQIPENQMQFGDVYLPDLVTSLGFGFATCSYSKTGLAVVQGVHDIVDLTAIYQQKVGRPKKIYLAGISEGGGIVTLLIERHPEIFAGGISLCGIVGDFRAQIQYLGDARATFEYYFPGLIPGDPLQPDDELIRSWSGPEGYYQTVVAPILRSPDYADAFHEWAKVARFPFDPEDREATLQLTAELLLSYNVINLNDAAGTLGGFPYDNQFTWYTGANDPWALNAAVPRVRADRNALETMRRQYTTTGVLKRPLMTLHTTLDPLVPYFHEPIYTAKNLKSNSYGTRRLNLPVERYGHCFFTLPEVLGMFAVLLSYNGDLHLLLKGLDTKSTRNPPLFPWHEFTAADVDSLAIDASFRTRPW